jgi:hypothetical protein
MDHGEQVASEPAVETRRRRFQFNLKTLFALTSLASVCAYAYDWSIHRPPFQEYSGERQVFDNFVSDLRAGRLKDAYESTSSHFQWQTTRRQFDALLHRYPTVRKGWIADRGSSVPPQKWMSLNRLSMHCISLSAKREPMTEVWVWIATDDSFFHRRPPTPRVEELQIRRTTPSNPPFDPPLLPSWDRRL